MQYRIPVPILEALRAYVNGAHPYPFGSFVTAVLANDLVEAATRADSDNATILHEYASYLYNEMPGRTGDPAHDYWGSYEAVANRIEEQREARDRRVYSYRSQFYEGDNAAPQPSGAA